MKNLIILVLCLTSLIINAQEAINNEFDGHTWQAPYYLPTLQDWGIERFPIPISFAPQILYEGVEDIRFSPGWANTKSDEYWTYAFLWYLDGSPKTDAEIIAGNLKAYYTGLIAANSEGKIPAEKLLPVITAFKETETDNGDLKTYTGTIEMLDYMQQEKLMLNCIVHLKVCADDNKTILFYELSPQPLTHKNWEYLDQLWLDFKCKIN
ncbi:MAG: hypothetical protein H7Y00_13925 [Fimbriimonadaceae bacterium]|nr:hypothetical protein [Chitinophagales bacterium]